MSPLTPRNTASKLRVFFACLLAFNILITPISAIASTYKNLEVRGQRSEKKDSTKAAAEDVFAKPLNDSTRTADSAKTDLANTTVPAALPAPAPLPAAPPVGSVTSSLAASLAAGQGGIDADGDGKADPGDTIAYTLSLANTSGAGATGLAIANPLDSHTTLVGSSLNSTPVAFDQSVQLNEDATLVITLTGQDPDGTVTPNFSFKKSDGTAFPGNPTTIATAHGTIGTFGSVTCDVHGVCSQQVTYTPAANYNGSDSFSFKANDSTANSNENGVVTITVNGVNDAPTFTVPSNPGAVNEDAGATTVTNYISGIRPAQSGNATEDTQNVSFVISNITHSALFTAGGQPNLTVSNSGNQPFPLTANLTYTPAPNANGTSVVTYHLHDNGGTANSGVDNSADQTFTITVNAVNDAPVVDPVAKAFTVQANMKSSGLTGLLANATDPDATNANADSLSADKAAGYTSPTFTLVSVTGACTALAQPCTITITNASTGTFNFDPPPGVTSPIVLNYTISDNGNPGSATSAAGTINVTVNGPVIWFVDPARANNGNGTLSDTSNAVGPFNSLASATSAMGVNSAQRIFVYSGTTALNAAVPLAGASTRANAQWLIGQGVVGSTFDSFFGISPPAGTFARPSISGTRPTIRGLVTVKDNTTVQGLNIDVSGASAGTKGILEGSLSNAATSTILIKDVNVTSADGIAADLGAGGTLTWETSNASTSPNTITSGTGTGLSVVNTTIGANGMTFRSITAGTGSASGGAGIILDNTGNTGSLTVSGNGSAGTGGTIQNKNGGDINTVNTDGTLNLTGTTGVGIFLRSTKSPSFSWMALHDFTNFAIVGSGVTGLTLNQVITSGVNGSNPNVHEGAMNFDNLTTSASITNTTIAGGVSNNFSLINTSGSLNRIVFDTCTFGAMDSGNVNGNDSLFVQGRNTATVNVTVQNTTMTSARGDMFQVDLTDTATADVLFKHNTVNNQHPFVVVGGGGLVLSGGGATGAAPTLTYDIGGANAGTDANTFRGARGDALLVVFQTGHGTATGKIRNNTFGVQAVDKSGASEASDIDIRTVGRAAQTVLISGNTLYQYANAGIMVQAGDISVVGTSGTIGDINATITNNTVSNPNTNASTKSGIHLNLGTTAAPADTTIMCADVQNNNAPNAGSTDASAGSDYVVRERQSTTMRLPGYTGTSADIAAVATYIKNRNTNGASSSVFVATPGGGAPGYTNTIPAGSQCVQPVLPSGAMFKPEGSKPQQYFAWLNTATDAAESQQNGPASSLAFLATANSLSDVLNARAATATVAPVEESRAVSAGASQVVMPTITAEARVGAVDSSGSHLASAMNSLSSVANAIAAVIEPTAHAEEATRETETTPVRSSEYSKARLNHTSAEGSREKVAAKANHASQEVRSPRLEVSNHAASVLFTPTPVGQFPINGTGNGQGFQLPDGKTITITFKATLNTPPNLSGPLNPKVSAQATLTGSFTGNPLLSDDPSVGGTTDPTSTTVDLYDSTTTITGASPSNSTNTGQAVTFTAAIGTAGTPDGSATARTGTVKFQDNGVDISGCTAQTVSTNQATCTTSALTTGTHNNIKAIYSGDGNFETSTSAAFTQTVTQNGTSTVVTSSQNPSVLTQNVTFTATVTSNGAVTPPTGTVQFHEGATNFGAPVALTTGGSCPATKACASFSKSDLATGAHTISGDYIPDPAFTASSGSVLQQVNQSDVSVAVSSSMNPSFVTQGVSFTAQVSSNTVITGPPTGTVQFKDGASNIGAAVALTTGGGCPVNKACATSITISTLTAGNHTITAEYSGDTNFAATIGTLSGGQQVNKSDTTTALVSSLNPSIVGNSVKFTATVTSNTAVTGPPAGKAQFFDGITAITCTDTGNGESGLNTGETLNGSGVATCTTSALTIGSHNITATYTGDGSANGSATFNSSTTTPALVQVVNNSCTTPITVMNVNDSGAGSLRKAIADVCDGGTINFDAVAFAAPGPYTIDLADTANNRLHVDKSVTITGPGSSILIVKRVSGATNNFRVFEIDAGKTVGISGMTISNGSDVGAAGTPNGGFAFGGGISNGGTLTLTNVIVSGNQATGGAGAAGVGVAGGNGGIGQGGGIFNSFSLTLINTTVSGNTATGGAGGNTDTPAMANGNGGAAQGGGIYSTGNLTLTNSTIGGAAANSSTGGNAGTGGTGGVAGSGDGGGVYDDAAGSPNTMSIAGSTINGNNAAANGGGIFIVGALTNATVTITNSTISENHANNDGGGISNAGASGTTTLTSVTVTRNTCDNDNDTFGAGGGVNVVNGTLTLRNTIVAGNLKGSLLLQGETATVVGTITVAGDAKVTVTAFGMPNSPKDILVPVANGDTASDVAGKIRAALTADTDVNGFFTVSGATDQVILTTRTAAANDATLNIATQDGTCTGLTAQPTSLDTPAGRAASDIAGSVDPASSFDLIGDANSAGGLSEPNANNNFVGVTGAGIRHITTILNSTLANNGGPTKTHALVANSVALDSGDDFSGPATTDQRGFVRPVNFVGGTPPGDDSDIGAYEQQTQPAAPNAPDLDAASDTGVSNTDNNTADTTPTFTIAGVASGAFVELLRDTVPASGQTVVASGTASGTSIQLTDPNATPDGVYRYTARQTVSGAPVSAESAFLDVTIDTTTPAAPDAPDLDTASDSGTSNTDNLTKFTSLTFTITSVSGTTVYLLRDTVPTTGFVVVASDTVSGSTKQLTDPSAPQGTYVYKSRISNGANTADSATTLTVVVDTTPPAAPGTPDLQAGSDTFGAGTTGTNTDNNTNAASRAFDVAFTAEAASTVTLLRGGSPVSLGIPTAAGDSSPKTLTDADSISGNPATAYLYTVRHTDAAGNSSESAVALSVTFDTVSAPAAPDLQAGSDSGSSSTDNRTKTTPRAFDITGTENGSLVELLRDTVPTTGAVVVTSGAGNGGTLILSDPNVLADGTYAYSVRQTDIAGNVGTSASALNVVLDTTVTANAPDLDAASDTGSSSTDNRTSAATPHVFNVTISEANSTVELLRGGVPVAGASTTGTGTVQLNDNDALADGTYQYSVRETDVAGNVNTSSNLAVTIDTTAPLVTSDTRASANPTSAATVDFTVTFSEDVTGVDATDFSASASGGLTGASVVSVTPVNAQQYTVTVNTGTGDGGLKLDVVNDNSIKDLVNLSLGAIFNTGEVYTVDRSNPSVVSITRAGPDPTNALSVDFLVTFSESVTGVDNADFTLTTSGVAGAGVSGVTGTGSTRTVTVNTGTGDGTIKLNLVDDDSIVDVVSKPLGGVGAGNGNFITGEVYTIDKTPPAVTVEQAIGQADPVTGPSASTIINFTATFTKSVTGLTAAGVTLSGTAGATVVNVSGSGTTYTLAVEGMTQSGTVIASINAGAAVDNAGNGNTASTSADNQVTYNLDNFTTFEVNTVADTDDGACSPLGTGPGNQDCTLREAINAANTDAGAETITFNSTVFAVPGPHVISLLTALPDITTDMTIQGPAANVLTVERNSGAATMFRIFTINSGTVTISGMTITKGLTADGLNGGLGAAGASGGGILNSGALTLSGVAVTSNTTGKGGNGSAASGGSGGSGGGISNNAGTLTVTNSTISGNQTGNGGNTVVPTPNTRGGSGGGISNSGTLTVTNSTISGNQTGAPGTGGILGGSNGFGGGIETNNNPLTISNSTITANNAGTGNGGGIRQSGAGIITIKSTIVGGNTAAIGPDIEGSVNSEGYNLIQSTSGATINETLNAGTNITGVSPQLNPLADNGGPTLTHSLLCTSPAIDKGNAFGLTADQRGSTRPFDFSDGVYANAAGGDGSDIGALETQSASGCLPTAVPVSSSTNEDTPVVITLTGTFAQNAPLTFTITQQPANAPALTPSAPVCSGGGPISCQSTVTYSPNSNFNGADLFKFKVSAGAGLDSDPADVNVTVNALNDAPSFSNGGTQTVAEDAGPQTVANFAVFIQPGPPDEGGQTVQFIVTNNTNPALFSAAPAIDPAGELTFTSAANAYGSAQITVVLKDNGGAGGGNVDTSAPQTFTINVTGVADTPSVTNASTPVNAQTTSGLVISRNAADGAEVTHFQITNITNGTLFKNNGTTQINNNDFITFAEGNQGLKFTPALNSNTNGSFDVQSSLNNTAGGLGGGTATATITITCGSAVVTNSNDSGAGSLRDVILHACPGATITFNMTPGNVTSPITLTSGELVINKDLTIQGPGANVLTISGNNASRIFNIASTFTVGLSGLTMSNGRVNTATSEGGAIQNNGTLTITGSTISGNTVNGSGINLGGGISNKTTGTLTLRDSTISGNSAPRGTSSDDGGGIYNQGVVTVINSTISGNSASLGGGLCMDPGSGTASIINSTVSGNSASIGGGGLHATGTVNVRNTIVAGNTGPSPDVRNAFVSQGNNLIGASDGSTGFTNGVNGDKVGTVASPLSALLAPLGNYGGPTQTMALLPGSPAIDAANNCVTDVAHCGDANIPQLTTDQRALARQVGSAVDIGAFESRGFTSAITSGTLQSAVFNTAFGAPLVVTVSSAFGEPVSGGQVVFTAPGSGASATFTGGVTTITSVINAGGQASATATANATVGGPYIVTATSNGITIPANFNLTNIKGDQAITFGAIANKTFGDPDFGVSATATSGLPVSFAASGNCTVTSPSPGTVHITGAGSCTITASQAGDANYNAATNVPQSFTIAKAASNTAVSSSVNPSDLGQSVTFTATVTSGTGTPTGTVQFKDNGNNLGAPVALNGSGVAQLATSALTTGTHTVTADYSGDANFLTSTATLSGGQVVKAQPSLSINDVSITEGDAGTKVLNFTVTLSAASSLTVTTNYATADGTATAPSDYAAIASTLLTFNPGDTSKQVSVTINGDVAFESDETFFVNLSSPVNATISDNQGLGTIQNDDAQGGFISVAQTNNNVSEITGIVTVTVTRTNDVSQAVNVDYATDDTGASISCAALNTGLASQRCDYTSMFGTLRFEANETQKTVDIPINLDAYTEGPEVFTFNLSNATGGAVLNASTATVTISDSPSPTPNAIDDTASFVRQLYHDFLNRDADAAGLAFWKNNIDKCNDPAQRAPGQTLAACIEVQRITTMAAFFLSIEFRQTGGMVRDFYVAALNRPLSNNMPGFVEFMRDTQAIQKGVTVGQGNWQQLLNANRLAFMNEFVTRAEFVALYPTTDTPTQYVDKLYQHANLTQTQQERLDAIEYFGGAATAADTGARAKALLLLTQNGDFQIREIRRAFVHMQYLGFLRRTPNEAPDNNFDGFNFWVTKLNQFNGDYLQAEMVKAFLSSLEYRRRFGQ